MGDFDKLESYLKDNLKEHPFDELENSLLKNGWRKQDIEHAHKKALEKGDKKTFIYIALILIVFAALALYGYFFVISPAFVQKPFLEKPSLDLESVSNENSQSATPSVIIKPEHLIFLLNEIDAYKLHNSVSGEIPKVKILISDTQQESWFSVSNNRVIEIPKSSNEDITLTANQNVFIDIYTSKNTHDTIMARYDDNTLQLDVKADIQTLALKGYKALYSYFGISGASILRIF